jgi:hypothetical protein
MSTAVPAFARDCDELTHTVKLLSEVVEESCKQIKILKEERVGTTGEVKDAYTLVIQNKVWCLQQVIGKFWRESLCLDLDNEVETRLPETITVDITEEEKSNAAAE